MSKKKKIITYFIFFSLQILFFQNAVSQDSIFFRNGRIISATINEINNEEVKYYDGSNPSGPLYVVLKKDIRQIKYKDNYVDSFTVVSSILTKPVYSKLELKHNSVYYLGKEVNDGNLLALLEEIDDKKAQDKLVNQFEQMKIHKKRHLVSRFIGPVIFGGSLFYGLILAAIELPVLGLGVAITGSVIFIATTIISISNKKKYLMQQKILVDNYNQLIK